MPPFRVLRERARLSIPAAADELGCSLSTVYRWERSNAEPKRPVREALERRALANFSVAGSTSFRFIDLFAGIGALRLGFEGIGGNCVYTSEWDKYCQQTYRKNFDVTHDIAGDIREVAPADIPDFDVLLAGFPCQPFSIAGVSKKNSLGRAHGFDDEKQGNLFFKIHEILKERRPAAFLLENVRNLVGHDRGITFDVIHRLLSDNAPAPVRGRRQRSSEEVERIEDLVMQHGPLGYNVSFRIIDAKGWVPQHRERIFIVGFRDDVGFDLDAMLVPSTAEGPRLSSILHEYRVDENRDGEYVLPDGRVNPRYTLSPGLWKYLQGYAEWHRERGNGFGFGLVGPDDVARTLSARYYKDGSEILVHQGADIEPRRLTPRECARLMGFHGPQGEEWQIPVSDTQAYKQFGNAAVVPVIEHLAKFMAPYIERVVATQEGGWQSPLPHLLSIPQPIAARLI